MTSSPRAVSQQIVTDKCIFTSPPSSPHLFPLTLHQSFLPAHWRACLRRWGEPSPPSTGEGTAVIIIFTHNSLCLFPCPLLCVVSHWYVRYSVSWPLSFCHAHVCLQCQHSLVPMFECVHAAIFPACSTHTPSSVIQWKSQKRMKQWDGAHRKVLCDYV